MPTTLSDALWACLPREIPRSPAGGGEEALGPAFRAVAELLFWRCTLWIAGEPHRLTELEFYWTSPGHPDPFTHGDPLQRQFGRWYLHRQGETYRGGTYKGLDLTIGARERVAGILLRGIASSSGLRIDGPSTVVEWILGRTGAATVATLAARLGPALGPLPGATAPLVLAFSGAQGTAGGGAEELAIIASPRVGLTLRRGADPLRCRYLARPYRFVLDPPTVTKGRLHLVLGLYAAGHPAPEIAVQTGVREATLTRYIAAYERGRGRDPADYSRRSLTTTELCELLGALA